MENPGALARCAANKGTFDMLFEASGNERALRGALDLTRQRGVLVRSGLAAT